MCFSSSVLVDSFFRLYVTVSLNFSLWFPGVWVSSVFSDNSGKTDCNSMLQEEIANQKEGEKPKEGLPFFHWICQPYIRPGWVTCFDTHGPFPPIPSVSAIESIPGAYINFKKSEDFGLFFILVWFFPSYCFIHGDVAHCLHLLVWIFLKFLSLWKVKIRNPTAAQNKNLMCSKYAA